jgi:hypothetical protein
VLTFLTIVHWQNVLQQQGLRSRDALFSKKDWEILHLLNYRNLRKETIWKIWSVTLIETA